MRVFYDVCVDLAISGCFVELFVCFVCSLWIDVSLGHDPGGGC